MYMLSKIDLFKFTSGFNTLNIYLNIVANIDQTILIILQYIYKYNLQN